jgi:ubiquitin-like protein Pup
MFFSTARQAPPSKQQQEAAEVANEEVTETERTPEQEALIDDLDDLLDEIDSVLEENAEEFVLQYVQRGGQ